MDQQILEAKNRKPKKEFRRMINSRLEISLAEFKDNVSEKKFNSALKEAGKLLTGVFFVKRKTEKKKKRTKETQELPEGLVM